MHPRQTDQLRVTAREGGVSKTIVALGAAASTVIALLAIVALSIGAWDPLVIVPHG